VQFNRFNREVSVVKTFRILYSCAIFLYLSVAVSSAEEKKYGLQELMDMAVEKSPSTMIFRADIEASKGDVLSSKAYPNPGIELEGGRGKSLDGSDSGGEYSVSIDQPLEWPKKRLFRRKAAEAALEVSRYETDAFRLELHSEVKKAFYRLLLNKKELEVASENLNTVNELMKTAGLRVKAGEAPEFELVKAQVEALKSEKELRRAENRVAIAKAQLNSLLGNTLPEGFEVDGDFSSTDKRYNMDDLLSIALTKHPFIIRQEKESEAKGYALEMERQSVFPDVRVKGLYGKEIDKETYTLGLSIPLPLWYQRKGEITTASAERAKAEAGLSKAKVELSLAIEVTCKDYHIALNQIEVFEKGLLRQSEEALSIAELSYKQGESGILDYLDAQRVHRQTLLDYNQARFELSLAVAELERLGGGLQ